MSKRRQKYSAEFKTKVVLEVLKEQETLSEIAGRYGIHPTQIAKWKRTFLEKSPEIFSEPGNDEAKKRASQEDEPQDFGILRESRLDDRSSGRNCDFSAILVDFVMDSRL